MNIADYHIHLEGADTLSTELQNFLDQALEFYRRNDKARKQFHKVTGVSFIELEKRLQSAKSSNDSKFSFDRFLTELYKSKLILTSTKEIAGAFTKAFLTEYFKKYKYIRMGFSPSILFEFHHITGLDWLDSFIDAINTVLIENKEAKIELVLETKRQLLTSEIDGMYGFEKNIEYLRYIRHRLNKEVTYSLSICDDASKYPLIEKHTLDNLENYLSFVREFDASISMHMLEQLPNLKNINKKLWDRVILNKTLELDSVLPILKKLNPKHLYLIHMCYLFGGAEPDPQKRTENDKKLVIKGLKYIEKLKELKTTIVVCYSSNEKLGFPCVLDYPEFRELLRHTLSSQNKSGNPPLSRRRSSFGGRARGDLTFDENFVRFGTDDPGPFGVRDIEEEMNLVKLKYKI